jgi:hypothetical protein
LIGKPKLYAIRHYKVILKSGELVEDKLMHAYFFENPIGELNGNIEGDYFWVKENELKKKVTKPLEEFWGLFEALKSFDGKISFKEIDIKTGKF